MKCRGRVGLQGERERESPRTEMHKKKIFWLSLQIKVYISQRASWLFRILRKSIPLQRSSTRLLLTPSCRQLRGIHWLPRAIRTRSVESKKQRTFGVQFTGFKSALCAVFVPLFSRRFWSDWLWLDVAPAHCSTLGFFFFPQQSVSHRLFCCVQEIPASQAAFNRTRTHIYSRLHFCIPHKKDLVEVRQM